MSVLIDGTPPEFRLSPRSLSSEEGSEGMLEIQQRDQNPSAPVERIEFNMVAADDPDKQFVESAICPNLTLSWPIGNTQHVKIVPTRRVQVPGGYLINARTADAVGRQTGDEPPAA